MNLDNLGSAGSAGTGAPGPSQPLHQITTHQQYTAPPLDIPALKASPIEQFSVWFAEAQKHPVPEPEAMSVATVEASTLQPSVRVVLLKQVDPRGFCFFTNYESRKGRELGMSPDLTAKHGNRAAAAFYWKEMSRSVRVAGRVERLSEEESYRYFSTRPIGSQIGAHASPQSKVVKDRRELERYVEDYEDMFGVQRGSAARKADDPVDKDKKVPLPKNWGGVRIVPDEVEFWVGRENRWVDRNEFMLRRGGRERDIGEAGDAHKDGNFIIGPADSTTGHDTPGSHPSPKNGWWRGLRRRRCYYCCSSRWLTKDRSRMPPDLVAAVMILQRTYLIELLRTVRRDRDLELWICVQSFEERRGQPLLSRPNSSSVSTDIAQGFEGLVQALGKSWVRATRNGLIRS